MKYPRTLAATLLIAFAATTSLLAADPARVNEGTQALLEGDYDEALLNYSQIETTSRSQEHTETVAFNRAVAHYRKGELGTARTLFDQTATAGDRTLAAKARFNLGNCDYAEALQQQETDRPAAIESLRRAIGNYRQSLQVNRHDQDARSNIELASRLIQALEQEEAEEQQQPQQNQSPQQDQNQPSQQDQQQAQDPSSPQDPSSEQDQGSEQDRETEQDRGSSPGHPQDQQEANSDPSESESEDPQASSPETADDRDDENSADADSASSPADSADPQAGHDTNPSSAPQEAGADESPSEESPSEESSSEESSSEENPSEETQPHASPADEQGRDEQRADPSAGDSSEEADRSPTQEMGTNSALSSGEQPDGDASRQAVPMYGESHSGEVNGEIDKQEAMKMLQAIRDRDLMRRIQKLQQARRQHVPVDRDW
ncbi:MAG: hypothetical protein AAGF97_01855 [Planctomycetota bacterium]